MPLPLVELPTQTPAEEIDEEILEIFIEEAEEVLEEIRSQSIAWRDNPSDKEALQTLRRAFHTLKGSGRLVGAGILGELGWGLEELFNKIIDGAIPRNNQILQLLDQTTQIIPSLIELFQAGDQTCPYKAHVLISQATHMLETKGTKLGEFVADDNAVDSNNDNEEINIDLDMSMDSDIELNFDDIEAEIAELTTELGTSDSEIEEIFSPAMAMETEDNSQQVLLDIFHGEAQQHLATLKEYITACCEHNACDITDTLVRLLHTLNGSARSVGFDDMSQIAAKMEKYARGCREKRIPFKKQVFNLIIESHESLEAILLNNGAADDAEGHINILMLWDEFLDELPEDEEIQARTEKLSTATIADTLGVSDDISEAVDEFMSIFLEEAEEILETSQSLLGRWQTAPNNLPLLKELQRELHTMKGGARMVGITSVGDLSHQLESILTKIVEGNTQSNPSLQNLVQESVDELASMIETVRKGETPQQANTLIASIERALVGDMSPAPIAKKTKRKELTNNDTQTSQERIKKDETIKPVKEEQLQDDNGENVRVRVRASLIDKLTNLAGELAISRAHMEQQQIAEQNNLHEMDDTVLRLRDQLRRLEIETEAQIISHFDPTTSDAVEKDDNEEFDLLEMDRFSLLQQLSRSLMETVNDLQNIKDNLSNLTRHSETLLVQQSRIGAELQDGIMRTRMVPFSQISPRLHRIARLTSRELKKQVKFSINDDSIEFERTILNRVIAPLEHMLRNAIGHGIESPETRQKLGKNPVANINMNLCREGAELVMTLQDDGAGINLTAIRDKAVERGLLEAGKAISEAELLDFILRPSFSTAKKVTQVAGRGVGMDVVNKEIKDLSGTLIIHTKEGQGTTFEIRLPLSLTISQALLVHVGEETLAVPLHNVNSVMRVMRDEVLFNDDQAHYYHYMDKNYRLAHLGDLLGFPRSDIDSPLIPLLLISAGDQRIALVVDFVEGSREVVIKSVGLQLSAIRWIAGATILGDGRVLIILDVLTLLRAHSQTNMVLPAQTILDAKEKLPVTTIMVVDDSITVRKVTARLLKRRGIEVMTAKDGVDAIAKLQDQIPDLMLLDVEMPRMDGFELATQVRNDKDLKHIPIIMITSRTGTKHRDRAAKIGINKHLGKPFNETELLENIESLLSEHGKKITYASLSD